MEKIRVIRIPEFKRIGKEEFVRKFINRPLEHYADLVYDFLLSTFDEKYGYSILVKGHRALFVAIIKLIDVMTLVYDLRDADWLKKHYSIDDPEILYSIKKHLSNVLVDEIKRVNTVANNIPFNAIDSLDVKRVINKWESFMKLIPSAFSIQRDVDGTISDAELESLTSSLASLSKEINNVFLQKNENIVNSLLLNINSYDIPLNNALYRDVYDCLELADLIPIEQLKMHQASTSRYVRENYIKSKCNRLFN